MSTWMSLLRWSETKGSKIRPPKAETWNGGPLETFGAKSSPPGPKPSKSPRSRFQKSGGAKRKKQFQTASKELTNIDISQKKTYRSYSNMLRPKITLKRDLKRNSKKKCKSCCSRHWHPWDSQLSSPSSCIPLGSPEHVPEEIKRLRLWLKKSSNIFSNLPNG